jgi:hypothetical protein
MSGVPFTPSDLFQRVDHWKWLFRGEAQKVFAEYLPPERENIVRTSLRMNAHRTRANAVFLRKSVAGSGPWGDKYPPYDGQFGSLLTVSGKDMLRAADLVVRVDADRFVVVKDRSGEYIPAPVDHS